MTCRKKELKKEETETEKKGTQSKNDANRNRNESKIDNIKGESDLEGHRDRHNGEKKDQRDIEIELCILTSVWVLHSRRQVEINQNAANHQNLFDFH